MCLYKVRSLLFEGNEQESEFYSNFRNVAEEGGRGGAPGLPQGKFEFD